MAQITWTDELRTGISDVDAQHLKLVNLINDLDSAMVHGKSNDSLDKILAALVQYTQIHFAAEERMLEANGFPDLLLHHAEHEKLTVRLIDLRSKFHAGRISLTPAVMGFLDDWLVKHISTMDKVYTSFLSSKGIN